MSTKMENGGTVAAMRADAQRELERLDDARVRRTTGAFAALAEGSGTQEDQDIIAGVLDALADDLEFMLELVYRRDVDGDDVINLGAVGRFLLGVKRRVMLAHELRTIELNPRPLGAPPATKPGDDAANETR